MRRTCFGVASLLFAGMCACGPTPAEAPPQPTPVAVIPSASATADTPTGPDLSPVPEPADIVGIGRWRNPMATVSNLATCTGVAPVIVEVNARMAVDQLLRQTLRGSVDTRKIAGLLSLESPVDLVMTLDAGDRMRPPLAAVAVGLTSLDGAKVAVSPDGHPPELAPGVWRVKASGAACAIAASAGATPARLVCAERETALATLAPYLARTAPGLDLGGPDIHVEARIGVLRKRYGDQLQNFLRSAPGAIRAEYGTGDERVDRLLFETATAVQEDAGKLLSDLSTIKAEVRSDRAGTCLRTSADVELSGTTSWLASALTDRLDRAAPPPAIYWRQPKDSEVALYQRGVDPALYATVLSKARDVLVAALTAGGITSPADRKKITELVQLPYGKDTNSVFSHGSVTVALPEPTSTAARQKLVEGMFAQLLGWTLIGVEEGPAALKKQLKATVDAYKLQSVQATLKKALGANDAKMLPTVKSVPAPAALGAGSEALEITIPNVPVLDDVFVGGKPPPKVTMSLKTHVLLMPDGGSTWLAFGAVKDELVKRMVAAKSSASDKEQLAARGDLDPLKDGKQMSGGFVSAAPFARKTATVLQTFFALAPGWSSSADKSFVQGLQSLPHGGRTPIFVTSSGTPGTPTTLHFAMDVRQGTFEDTKALVMSSYSFFSQIGLLP